MYRDKQSVSTEGARRDPERFSVLHKHLTSQKDTEMFQVEVMTYAPEPFVLFCLHN